MSAYHVPVMLAQCLDGLAIKPDGLYVDVTFGGGGHSKEILKRLKTGKLIAFDQDTDAAEEAKKITDPNFVFVAANFGLIKKYLKVYGFSGVDGILADLGISSHQIDEGPRGFSTRFNGPLDMRMNQAQELTAEHIVNNYTAENLHKILGMFGEVHNARTLGAALVAARAPKKIKTSEDLIEILKKYAPRGKEFKYYAQVFQALRIEVNKEIEVLEQFLAQVPEVLNPGGRLVVMSYHSLEDRPVKNFIAKGKFYGDVEKDDFGNQLKPLTGITRKPVEATAEEILTNPRARSAKLRIAEKR